MSSTLRRAERLKSRKSTDELFAHGESKTIHPVRMVHRQNERHEGEAPLQLLVSVPKRRCRHAVQRNRIKRQLREAFRRNKHLADGIAPEGHKIEIALIWQSGKEKTTSEVEQCVCSLLRSLHQ